MTDQMLIFQQDEHVGLAPVTNRKLFWRRFLRHKPAVISAVVLILLMIACYGAKWIAPYPKNQQADLLATATGPSAKHLLGTDDFGKDQLSQILYAGQVSLTIGLTVAALSTLIGVIIGSLAGFYGRFVDQGLSRVTDLFLVVPDIAALAVLLKYFGGTPEVMIFVLAALGWTYVARVLRGDVLALKEKEFVEGARVRSLRRSHHHPTSVTELRRFDCREHDAGGCRRDRRRVDVDVPRHRASAPEYVVGFDVEHVRVGSNRTAPLVPDDGSVVVLPHHGPRRELHR